MQKANAFMPGIVIVLVSILIFGSPCFADCTGCCSGHGGVVCSGGVTKCGDGTALSQTCVAKGCDMCGSSSTCPTVNTGSASSITSNSATLNGQVNPNGFSTTYYFDYGTTISYGMNTATFSAGSGTSSISVSIPITGLTPSTTYHYRLVSTNGGGTSNGNDATFTSSGTSPPPTDSTGSSSLIFPHIADGMGYKTELLLTNGSDANTTATLSFFSDTGDPLDVPVGDITASSFTFPIAAHGSAMIPTSGSSPNFTGGWAKVTCSHSANLSGNAIFQSFNGSDLFSEASIPAAPAISSARFYADEEGGFNTGLAVANPGPVKAIGTLTLRDLSGTFIASEPIELDPGNHFSMFLYQIFPDAPSGSAEVNLNSGSLSLTTLRIHSSGIFSTVTVSWTPASALFSPDGEVRSRIISEISKARSSIDIAIYSFTADEIRDALVAAKSRGVAIRIIADSSQASGQGSEIATLEGLGFNLKRMSGESGGIMHNKYMIIDSSLLVTGSYNWSANAEDNNYENAIFIEGVSVIQDYIADFEKLWEK
jgi:hypothetical protein